MVDRKEYYSNEEWNAFINYSNEVPTPFVVINLDIIRRNFKVLKEKFPYAHIYYAVKANPAVEIISLLNELGSSFDIASRFELDKVLALGVNPERISYGNTIKKSVDIEYFYKKGVKMYASDSKADLHNIAKFAPGSKVYIRILVEGSETADWPLSRKFGCHPDMAYNLVVEARDMGLEPYGISFHVGSQQRDIGQWDEAISKTKYLFNSLLEEENIELKMINMGGGFPANYLQKANLLQDYSNEITRYLKDDFGDEIPQIILEPGRSLVGNSGILVTEVVLISRKNNTALQRWVYVDAGKFNGLIETLDESIKYPVVTEHHEERMAKNGEVILAGPTCDSMDVMYEKFKYQLPLNLQIGERLYWLSTGAYTTSYASVEFNGFPPIKPHFIDSSKNS